MSIWQKYHLFGRERWELLNIRIQSGALGLVDAFAIAATGIFGREFLEMSVRVLSIIRSSALKSDASIHIMPMIPFLALDSKRLQRIALEFSLEKKLLYISGSTSPQRDIKKVFSSTSKYKDDSTWTTGFWEH